MAPRTGSGQGSDSGKRAGGWASKMGVPGGPDCSDCGLLAPSRNAQLLLAIHGAHTCYPVSSVPLSLAGPLGSLLPAAFWSRCCQPYCLGTFTGHLPVTKEKTKLTTKTVWMKAWEGVGRSRLTLDLNGF